MEIGRYRLQEPIGEGGMGMVWVAEQIEPVKRRVALKLIKPGMDSRQVLARFDAERQALALMDHPNIAKVHDGGMTDEGRPFFVMEYVKGVPITEFCDAERLSIAARLKLFIPVCHAVQHAHQKGVIHRDLKPSNILVCLYDGIPVPKVIDFGLAKAISQPLTEHSFFTAHGLMVGTPLYMSPEQAEFNNLDVDTRTDIYSLGVILYELLTGTTPLEKQQLNAAALQEILRLIKEVEPPSPSAKLSGSACLPVVAAQRSIDPEQLWRAVKGDLDWIAMKSLEKERARRYETASALARDIERHLQDEPIEARPPSAVYRLCKVARKNRALLATTALLATILSLGAAVSTWQAIRATRAQEAERAAKLQALSAASTAQQARQKAESSAAAEKAAKEQAQARQRETEAVLKFLENHIFGGLDGSPDSSREPTFRETVQSALPLIEANFSSEPLLEARLRMALGRAYSSLREWPTAVGQLEAARGLFSKYLGHDQPDSLHCMTELGYAYFEAGKPEEGLRLWEEELAILKATAGPDDRDTLRFAHQLANKYYEFGRRAEALKLREETLGRRTAALGPDDADSLWSMQELANSYLNAGRSAEAIKLDEEALRLRRMTLGVDHPDTLCSMNSVANQYADRERHEEALKLREETLALRTARLGPDHLHALASMRSLARSYLAVGRHEEALALAERTLRGYQARFGDGHRITFPARRVLANCYAANGRQAEALQHWKVSLKLHTAAFSRGHPDTLLVLRGLAETLLDLGRDGEALPLLDECLEHATGQLIDPKFVMSVVDFRRRHFPHESDAEDCRKLAEIWEKLQFEDPHSLYRAACLRAIASAAAGGADSSHTGSTEVNAEADRAMAWLQKAVTAGYCNTIRLATDKDLNSLRGRDDFQKLLADLQGDQHQAGQNTAK